MKWIDKIYYTSSMQELEEEAKIAKIYKDWERYNDIMDYMEQGGGWTTETKKEGIKK